MYVKNNMLTSARLTKLQLDESIDNALKKLNERDFLSLPVFDGEEFKGILMRSSIYSNYFENDSCDDKEEYLRDTRVKDLYRSDYKSLDENELIENASYLLKEWKTPFIPVFNRKEEFVGILTHNSIFDAFSDILGFSDGTRIIVNVFDMPGQLAKLAEIIEDEDINISNFVATDIDKLDLLKVVIRLDTEDDDEIENLVHKITEAGFRIGGVVKE